MSDPVTKLELIEILTERENTLSVQITTTIRDLVNGNLKATIQDFEMKSLKAHQEITNTITKISSDHIEATNKINLVLRDLQNASKKALGHTQRLFEITDDIKDQKLPGITKHLDQQRGAMKFWGVMCAIAAAAAGLVAALK